jgi:hypothetical protein
VLDITHLADRRPAVYVNTADFSRRQLEQCVIAFAVAEDDLDACAARHLAAASGLQFDVVHGKSQWDLT